MVGSGHDKQATSTPSQSGADAPGAACLEVCEAAIGAFVSSLAERLRREGGSLDAAGLETAMRDFMRDSNGLHQLSEEAGVACRAVFEHQRRAHMRKDFFGRLIVHPFAHLLADSFSAPDEAPRLSRAFIKPFFTALKLMLGEAFLDDRHRRCEVVASEICARHGEDHDWAMFYTDRRMRAVLANTLFEIAAAFESFERRKTWFIGIVNQELDGDPFTHIHFAALMAALFAPVREQGLRPADNDRLKARTETFLAHLEALERETGLS